MNALFVCKNHLKNGCNVRVEKSDSFCQNCLSSKHGTGIFCCANKKCYNRISKQGDLCDICHKKVSGYGGSVSRKKCRWCNNPVAPYSHDCCASHD